MVDHRGLTCPLQIGPDPTLEHVPKPMSLLKRDEAGCKLNHREVVRRDAFPANQDAAESVVPTVGSLDDPSTWLPPYASDHRLLSAPANVRDDASASNGLLAVGVVVSPVQAQMPRTGRNEHAAKHHSIERFGNQPLVVHVGSRDQHRQRHAASIGENVPFHAEFPAVRRVRPRVAPPLGAFAMALSSEAKSHLIPRRFS